MKKFVEAIKIRTPFAAAKTEGEDRISGMEKLTFELAKKLKNAGWSQTQNEPLGLWRTFDFLEEPLYAPSLSELIAACPRTWSDDSGLRTDLPFTLQAVGNWLRQDKDGWRAEYALNDWSGPKAFGATPEEAVARLWLLLPR